MKQFQLRPLNSGLHSALETIARHACSEEEAQEWISFYMSARGSETGARLMKRAAGRALSIAIAGDETRQALERQHEGENLLTSKRFELPFSELEEPFSPINADPENYQASVLKGDGGLSEVR